MVFFWLELIKRVQVHTLNIDTGMFDTHDSEYLCDDGLHVLHHAFFRCTSVQIHFPFHLR